MIDAACAPPLKPAPMPRLDGGSIKGLRVGQREKIELDMPSLPGAACKELGYEDLFFPERSQAKAKQAKMLCARCPVREACRDWALDWDRKHPKAVDHVQGIWGGTTEGERKMILEKETDAVA